MGSEDMRLTVLLVGSTACKIRFRLPIRGGGFYCYSIQPGHSHSCSCFEGLEWPNG